MDWRYEAIDKLRGYRARSQALNNIPAEMERLESALKGTRSARTDGTPVQGGGSGREDALLSNIVHRQELEHTLEQARLWVQMVDRALAVLDEDDRMVLDMMYINRSRGNVGRLREALGLQDDRSVYKRKDKALRMFTLALYGITET